MKSKILIFFVVLFTVLPIAAQPGQYPGFNPDDLCRYKEGKIIFVGRVISTEEVSADSLPSTLKDSSRRTLKHIVSVEKVFKGQLKIHEIKELFVIKRGADAPYDANDEIIFVAEETSLNGSKFLRLIDWSYPLNKYGKEKTAVVFPRIEARIRRYPKSPSLSGIVFQTDSAPKYSFALELVYGYEYRNFKPVAGITMVAKSKANNRVFKTKTNAGGVFSFDNLEDGDYALSIVVPKGFEQDFSYEHFNKDYERVLPVKKTSCLRGAVFKIRKARK